jgi:hypothetical protein
MHWKPGWQSLFDWQGQAQRPCWVLQRWERQVASAWQGNAIGAGSDMPPLVPGGGCCGWAWCAEHNVNPLQARRTHIKVYARELEQHGRAAATVRLKLTVIAGWYHYLVDDQLLEHSPATHVRRPRVSQESTRLGLDRNQLGALLVQAGLTGGTEHALVSLLALNALRV